MALRELQQSDGDQSSPEERLPLAPDLPPPLLLLQGESLPANPDATTADPPAEPQQVDPAAVSPSEVDSASRETPLPVPPPPLLPPPLP
jgi:hypothetical protein